MFDAGALARLYAEDVSSRSLRAIRSAYPSATYAPSFAASEMASAWLQFVRAGRGGDGERLSWDDYDELMAHFLKDEDDGFVQLIAADEFARPALGLLEENVRRHMEDVSLPGERRVPGVLVAVVRLGDRRPARLHRPAPGAVHVDPFGNYVGLYAA